MYADAVDFTQGGNTFRADACITLAWLPSPHVRFDVPALQQFPLAPTGPLTLKLSDGTAVVRAFANRLRSSGGPEGARASLFGEIQERVLRPADAEAAYALFLMPNFKGAMGHAVQHSDGSIGASRLVLVGGGWRITLDKTDNEKKVWEFLTAFSGYGVTTVGRLEREDSSPFKADDAMRILDALACYSSFVCGRWTGPCLPMGFGANNKQVWQVWDYSRTAPYLKCLSWADTCCREHFEEPFPGFLKLWHDDAWEEIVRLAIHWYIEANAQAGSVEGSLVLILTAFELLTSAVLVDNYGVLSRSRYEAMSASDRILQLFSWAGIPSAVPPDLILLR